MIECAACKINKDENEFYNNSVKINGKDSKCKECRKNKSKLWIQENLNRYKESRKEYYHANKDVILSRKHEYYTENRDKILADKTDYWNKNKEKIKERVLKWRKANKEVLEQKDKERRILTTKAVLDLLGKECKSCNETEIEFLTVDHIHNNGNKERAFRPTLGWKRDIINGKSNINDYQVLCHNCNQLKYNLNPLHHYKVLEPIGILKKCIHCEAEKDLSEFKSQNSHEKAVCLKCSRVRKKVTKNDRKTIIGTNCKCCGIHDLDLLTVDHVNSDGNVRRKNGQRTGEGLLYEATLGGAANPSYQLLCYNCNYSKHLGKGKCIHHRPNASVRLPLSHIKPKISASVELIDFNIKDIIITQVMDHSEAKLFLNSYHYAGFGRGATNVYEIRLRDELVSVVKFAPPVRQGIANTLDVEKNEILELDRFCIHPARHKHNLASRIMSLVIKSISAEIPNIKKLVSFADPRYGHSGGIYKASNWIYVGKTSTSYYYEDADGKEVNKKTLYNYAKARNMNERKCVEMLGYKKIRTPAKYKYYYNIK